MTPEVGPAEHADRVRRVRSVPCPRCGAGKGQPCKSPGGGKTTPHHQARYDRLYARRGRRS